MIARVFGLALVGLLSLGCETTGEIAQPGARPVIKPLTIDAGAAVKRTIEDRSPFGNTSYPANLLADGDFEFTGRSEQMPWIVFAAAGQGTLNYDTGGLCHSGVRCALIAQGDVLLGYLASPKTGTMDISLWIAPLAAGGSSPPPACKTVSLSMTNLDDQTMHADIGSETDNPVAGWCHFAGSAPNFASKAPVLLVSLAAKVEDGGVGVVNARVDDGVIKPSAGAAGRVAFVQKYSAAEAARVAFIAEYLRTHRRY